jgi:cyanophycinase
MKHNILFFVSVMILVSGCMQNDVSSADPHPKGKLFIIGGGKRPMELIQRLVDATDLAEGRYILVLPMSSEEPDTAFYYAVKQFTEHGIAAERICRLPSPSPKLLTDEQIDSVLQAAMIYIPGGDQNRFMAYANPSGLTKAIRQAYLHGAVVAGTSAGAAVMSRMMITGNELKYPEYTGNYRTIESGNIELGTGLGLLGDVVIDQHFVYRMRMNRLISVVLEHPGIMGIGIDEATAVLIHRDTAEVVGLSQVIVLRNETPHTITRKNLLGGNGLRLDVLLPGDKFHVPSRMIRDE